MNCRRVSSLVSAYIDGELTGVEMLEIRDHLGGCRSCTEQYETLRSTKQLLARLQYAQPRAGLAESICLRLDEIRVPAYQRVLHRVLGFGHSRLKPVAVACTAMGVGLVVLMAHPGINQVERPSTYMVSAISMPEGAMIPYEKYVNEHASSHPLIPEPVSVEPNSSSMFAFASYTGNN